MSSMNSRGNLAIVLVATLLSGFNGLLSVLSVMVFSGEEGPWMWVSIYLPTILWVAAALSYKFPRGGMLSFSLLIGVILALRIQLSAHLPIGRDQLLNLAYNLRFAFIGIALLLVNLFVPRKAAN